MSGKMITSVLFVCLGNICRSRTAQGNFRDKDPPWALSDCRKSWNCGRHLAKSPYELMRTTAAEFGYDLPPLHAGQVVQGDFSNFDLTVAIDEQKFRDLQALPSRTDTVELIVIGAYITSDAPPDIRDPYNKRNFVGVLKLVQRVVNNMILANWPYYSRK